LLETILLFLFLALFFIVFSYGCISYVILLPWKLRSYVLMNTKLIGENQFLMELRHLLRIH